MIVMGLIHDDKCESPHEPGPALMVRQHAVVQRVGVGQQKPAELAQLCAGILACIPVVDCRVDMGEAVAQPPHLGELVFDECLCRVQEQSSRCRMLEQMVQHRQLKRKALAARRRAYHGDVVAVAGSIIDGPLEGVELYDPHACKVGGQVWMKVGRQGSKRRFVCRKLQTPVDLAVVVLCCGQLP